VDLAPSSELVYILAVLLGDGHVDGIGKKSHSITFNSIYPEFVLSYVESMSKLGFSPKSKGPYMGPKSKRPHYRVAVGSRVFASWFNNLSLQDIKDLALMYPIYFIRGFYESEGSYGLRVHRVRGTRRTHEYIRSWIRVGNMDVTKLEIVKECLSALGFFPWIRTRKGDNYSTLFLGENGKRDVEFIKKIKPCIKKVPSNTKLLDVMGPLRNNVPIQKRVSLGHYEVKLGGE